MSKHTVELTEDILFKLHLAATAYGKHHEEINGMDMEDIIINRAIEDFFSKHAEFINENS